MSGAKVKPVASFDEKKRCPLSRDITVVCGAFGLINLNAETGNLSY